jgi:3-oxoacyl-(acyl-carrier-protein) synthase
MEDRMDGTGDVEVVITGLGPLAAVDLGRGELAPVDPLAELEGTGGDPRLRQADRPSRLTLEAVGRAVADAGLGGGFPPGSGIAMGSGMGCIATNADYLQTILARGSRFGNPTVFQNTVPNAAAGYASVLHGLNGPTATFCSGGAAGLEAVAFAVHAVAAGRAPVMVAGGFEELSPWLREYRRVPAMVAAAVPSIPTAAGFGGAAPAPVLDVQTSPNDLAEGACALILESAASLRRRGGGAYARVAAVAHGGGPPAASGAVVVGRALERAGRGVTDVDLVVTAEDGEESLLPGVPRTSAAARVGDTTGAAGPFAVALAALLLAGTVPSDPSPRPRTVVVAGGDDAGTFALVLERWKS